MKIEQKKLDTHIIFEFQEEAVKYSLKDKNHSESFSVPYEEISRDTSEFEERNQWYRNVAVYLGILGAIAFVYDAMEYGRFRIPIWHVVAAVFALMYYKLRVGYTIIDCASHRLYVIKDRYHDQIMKTLQAWRANYLLGKYGKLNPANDPNDELRKFAWLKSQEVISAEEFEKIRSQLSDKL